MTVSILKFVGRVAAGAMLLCALHIVAFSWESWVFLIGLCLFEATKE